MVEQNVSLDSGTSGGRPRAHESQGGSLGGMARQSWAPIVGAFLIPAVLITLVLIGHYSR